ncbi:hypothetical protein MMC13_006837 [Lambiella insularis]|nr:hypothetical protein [Lambiella insularis]
MLGLILSLLLVTALWFLQGQRSGIRRNGKRLPRPPGTLPFAGNGLWFLQPRHKLLDWFAQVQPVVGFDTYEISIPSLPPAIVVSDPKNVEHVLKNNELFIKGEFFRSRSWDLFGNGIINADGELWRIQRKAGLRFFSNSNLRTFINDVLPPVLAETQLGLDKASETGSVVDLQHVLLELTTRLMGRMAYNMDMHGGLPFSKAFDYASGETTNRFTNPFWKVKEFFSGSRLRTAIADVRAFGRTVVTEAAAKRSTQKCEEGMLDDTAYLSAPPALQTNLINSLLDHLPTSELVADAAMNFLSAGRDTTAQSMTWTFYTLMRHPEFVLDIRKELSSICPKFAFSTEPQSSHHTTLPLSYDTVQPTSLPYTQAVFNEVIRLYPPVPFELKETTADTTFPDGTYLPAKSVVLWVPWGMGRSTLIWGEHATKVQPERWLEKSTEDGKLSLITKSAYENPVFNAGPRACLGKKMAELLAVYVIATLTWEYDFGEVMEKENGGCGIGKERVSQNSLTLPMEGGLPCMVKRKPHLEESK